MLKVLASNIPNDMVDIQLRNGSTWCIQINNELVYAAKWIVILWMVIDKLSRKLDSFCQASLNKLKL